MLTILLRYCLTRHDRRFLRRAAQARICPDRPRVRRPQWVRGTDGSTFPALGNGLNALFLPWPRHSTT